MGQRGKIDAKKSILQEVPENADELGGSKSNEFLMITLENYVFTSLNLASG